MTKPNRADNRQVRDDVHLLHEMMADLDKADELYKPTNYWQVYEKMFMPELEKHGLHNFRRRRNGVLESFCAVDLLLSGKITPRAKFRGSERIIRLIEKVALENPFFPFRGLNLISPQWPTDYFYYYVQKKFESVKLDLGKCPATLIGNPEDALEINNRMWSLIHLNYCSMIADAAQHIEFNDKMCVCELGAGMGRNIEILASLFPGATLLLFDIPPQLYVSNQYLSTVFPERVIPYRQAVSLKPLNSVQFRDSIKGKIVILPTWLMPEWSSFTVELFWNSASFQEMEPPVVKNYLEIVKKQSPRYIYISARPQGNYWGEWKPGRGGTKEPVLGKYYFDYLKDKYRLKVEYDTDYFLRIKEYKSYIFEKITC